MGVIARQVCVSAVVVVAITREGRHGDHRYKQQYSPPPLAPSTIQMGRGNKHTKECTNSAPRSKPNASPSETWPV